MNAISLTTLRIAVASSDGGLVDQHFGQAEQFLIYDVRSGQQELVDKRSIDALAQPDEERRETIRRILADCTALLVARVGETPQAMMAEAGIDATAAFVDQPVEQALQTYLVQGKKECRSANNGPDGDGDAPIPYDQFRIVHTMLRVGDMEKSVDFYTRLLGMKVIEQRDHKKNQFTQTYLGYGDGQTLIELVMNWNRDTPYDQGDAYGHFAIGVKGIWALCQKLEAEGVTLPRPPRSQRHGNTIVAFAQDPDGYQIELVQYPSAPQ